MASGVTLAFVAFLSATSPRAIFTSSLPACDEQGLSDEDAEAVERDQAEADRALTPLFEITADGATRLCAEPDVAPPPAVVDCNSGRASLWVQEMVGRCDMPRLLGYGGHGHGPSLRALRPGADRHRGDPRNLLCEGGSCYQDPPPVRQVSPGGDGPALALVELTAPPPAFPPSALYEAPRLLPESLPPGTPFRPPRA